jgi:hypothetical protein
VRTRFIEATQDAENGFNWGKFVVGRWEPEEWARRSELPAAEGQPLIGGRGWSARHVWVLDLQTGEGAYFLPGGMAEADLSKHRIWVCPMFEPFLRWLYAQDLSDLDGLPGLVELAAPGAVAGYRRDGV